MDIPRKSWYFSWYLVFQESQYQKLKTLVAVGFSGGYHGKIPRPNFRYQGFCEETMSKLSDTFLRGLKATGQVQKRGASWNPRFLQKAFSVCLKFWPLSLSAKAHGGLG
jgi:hypothetical protein